MNRLIGIMAWVMLLSYSLYAQQGSNPFELSPRLSPEEQAATQDSAPSAINQVPANPFDLSPRLPAANTSPSLTPSRPTANANPFDLTPRKSEQIAVFPPPTRSTPERVVTPAPRSQQEQSQQSGWLLVSLIVLLGLSTVTLIFFRTLYQKAYRAFFNDNLLWQLYREREGGQIGQYLLTYPLFFLSSSFFLYLCAEEFGSLPTGIFMEDYTAILLLVTGVFLVKHFVLSMMGYIFPIKKETSRYSFSIMAFGVVLGLLFALASLLLAYAPDEAKRPIIYLVGIVVFLAYAIRSLRGLFIGNRFLLRHQFHFLLYLCAIEIVPALLIYKEVLKG